MDAQNRGKWADSIIGYIGGILGGLGGFCGALPSAWLMLKKTPKEQQRYILVILISQFKS